MKKFLAVMNIIGPFVERAGSLDAVGDAILDALEDFVQRTDNTIDDKLILPVIKCIREGGEE